MIVSFLKNPYNFISGSVYSIYENTSSGDKNVAFQFDSIEEVMFRATSNVTSYPIEKGYLVTDYKYDNPDVLQVKALVSRRSIVGSLIDTALDRESIIKKLDTSLKFYKSGMYALNIVTKTGVRENYTLQDYEIPETYDNYGIAEIFMTFAEIMTSKEEDKKIGVDKNTIFAGIVKTLQLDGTV